MNLEEVEKRLLDDLDIDYVPLNDVVREFSKFNRTPNEADFGNAIAFLDYWLHKHSIIQCLYGPGGTIIGMPTKEFLDWLNYKWSLGLYEELAYAIWFEKK